MNQHSDDLAVDRFATAMKEKLAQARAKGRCGWEECAPADLSAMLYEHVEKGDPRDVANFCMFLWSLGQPITPCHKAPAVAQEPVGEIQIEDMGQPFNAMRVRVHFYKEVPQVGAKIYTKAPAVAPNETLLEAAKRAINYSQNVLKAEGVYFDDDEDLPFIVAAINQAEPVPDLPPEWIDEEATP